MDHTGALVTLQSKLDIPVAAHADDANKLPLKPHFLLNHGDTISHGSIDLKVLHTPGHTPGSLSFIIGKYLFSGDTIFPGGPGKTWSPSDFKQILESITKQIFTLSEDTKIYPGHGDTTILKKEKKEFAIFSSRSHGPRLYGDILWLST
jgi:glyoxylase-like metal-dependent hydrolase (beta-lactamase superfamily II)